jgi:hypothetical protein
MLRGFTWLFLVCACGAWAQSADSPETARARQTIEKLKTLVEAGAIPRAQLDRAEDQLADAEDAAFLRRTVYGQELTPEQTDQMIAAADRRFERRKKAFDEGKKLVEAGVASEASLGTLLDELDLAKKECDLAESRAKFTRELAEMAKAEETLDNRLTNQPAEAHGIAERFDGDGVFTAATFSRVEAAFASRFGHPLPVSAMGETAVHRSLGFDHRGRVDVALYPDTEEGIWLREYLTENRIPYFAFRQAVAGKATGAHIHLGPMSTKLRLGG